MVAAVVVVALWTSNQRNGPSGRHKLKRFISSTADNTLVMGIGSARS